LPFNYSAIADHITQSASAQFVKPPPTRHDTFNIAHPTTNNANTNDKTFDCDRYSLGQSSQQSPTHLPPQYMSGRLADPSM